MVDNTLTISPYLENLKINKKEYYYAYTCMKNPMTLESCMHIDGIEKYFTCDLTNKPIICNEKGPGMCVIYENDLVTNVMISENLSELFCKLLNKNYDNKKKYVFYYCDFYRGDNVEYYVGILKKYKQMIKRGNIIKKIIKNKLENF